MSEFNSFGASDSSSYDFSSDPTGSIGGTGGSMAQFQMMVQQEQQRALIQKAVARIADVAFDKCVGKPDSALSSREKSCIENVAGSYVDTSLFIVKRLSTAGK